MRPDQASHRQRRKRRIRSRIAGTPDRPRMSVYRSLRQITVQLIDDTKGRTLVAASTKHVKSKPDAKGAAKLGEYLAKHAKAKKVSAVVFDRNAYRYHGRLKALADAAREGGLRF